MERQISDNTEMQPRRLQQDRDPRTRIRNGDALIIHVCSMKFKFSVQNVYFFMSSSFVLFFEANKSVGGSVASHNRQLETTGIF